MAFSRHGEKLAKRIMSAPGSACPPQGVAEATDVQGRIVMFLSSSN